MGLRKNDKKNYNYRRRQAKKERKNKEYQKQEQKKAALKVLAQKEIIEAVRTLPQPGATRAPLTDENTPSNYIHYRIQKNAKICTDRLFGVESSKIEEKIDEEELLSGQITPAASYDFFDNVE